MYGMDRGFWAAPSSDSKRWPSVLHEAIDRFEGQRIVPFALDRCRRERFRKCTNSGAGAIALAAHWGAARIILLGYDCKFGADGRRHHHPDHPAPLGNCGSLKRWGGEFRKLADELRGRVSILNASRDTALTMFPRATLEEALS